MSRGSLAVLRPGGGAAHFGPLGSPALRGGGDDDAVHGGLLAHEAILVVPRLADLGVDPGVEEEERGEGQEPRGEDVVPVGAKLYVTRVHHQPSGRDSMY